MTDVVVALDVGGTAIKCAVVDATGAVRHAERHDTGASRGPRAVTATIVETVGALADRARADGCTPRAAGIAVPGLVDEAAGVATLSANVGFRDTPLRDLVSAHTGLPVALGHDVRAGGLAESRLGAGRGRAHVLFVALGTGVAAAHVVDGRPRAGAHNAAGELGHIVVRPGGTPCACGARGCLEAYSSAAAIARGYTERARRPATAAQVAQLAASGDGLATSVWATAVEALADGLSTAQALYDVDAIVVGGGLAQSGEALLAPLREALRARLTFHREPEILRAELGEQAGCLGAALLARRLVDRLPLDQRRPVAV